MELERNYQKKHNAKIILDLMPKRYYFPLSQAVYSYEMW